MNNTLKMSCELLETLRRISVTVTCTNCTCFQPIAIIGDSPIIISNLIAGQYTIEMTIADITEINDTIVEMITLSDNDKPINSTVIKTITESNKCATLPTNGPTCESMYVMYTPSYVRMLHVIYGVRVYVLATFRDGFRGFLGSPETPSSQFFKIVHKLSTYIKIIRWYRLLDCCNLMPLVVVRKPLPIIFRSAPAAFNTHL